MKRVVLFVHVSTIAFVSCKKEKFPAVDDLKGSWVEQTNQTFKHRLFFNEGTMYFIKPTITDTFLHRLDNEEELIFLQLKNNPTSGETSHKIQIDRHRSELIIWGLFGGLPSYISESKFNKE